MPYLSRKYSFPIDLTQYLSYRKIRKNTPFAEKQIETSARRATTEKDRRTWHLHLVQGVQVKGIRFQTRHRYQLPISSDIQLGSKHGPQELDQLLPKSRRNPKERHKNEQ